MNNYKLIKDGKILHSVSTDVTEFTIPDTVEKIGLYAFEDCEKLKNIDIPNIVHTIEESAFSNCYSLTTINISKNVWLKEFTFYNCISLKIANLPNIDQINIGTFSGCINLTTVNIPKVKFIHYKAFEGCDSLNNIITTLDDTDLIYAFGDEEQYKKYLIRKRNYKINQILQYGNLIDIKYNEII